MNTLNRIAPVALAVLLLLLGPFGWLASGAGRLPSPIARFELKAACVIQEYRDGAAIEAAMRALRWDFLFIPIYVSLLALVCAVFVQFASSARLWRIAGLAFAGAAA